MGNMSHCRFRNTLIDLRDCDEHIDEDLDEDENRARINLIKTCIDIAQQHEDEDLEELFG